MKFPTPPGHNDPKPNPEPTPEPEPETEPETDDGEPVFPDDMSQRELLAAIEEYQEWCAEHYDALQIELDGIPVEVSTKLKRTAGKVAHVKGTDEVKYIRYAVKAYEKWGWEQFTETIRHELIHVHTIQNYQRGGHGQLFKNLVRPLETHRHCESFASSEAKYHLRCSECDELVAERFQRSKTVKHPERYRSKCCREPLRVEVNR